MRTVVVGANGQLGHTLCKKLGAAAVGLTEDQLDITDLDAVLLAFSELRPDIVINAAAYTNVDAAEENADVCHRVNVEGTENLVQGVTAMDAVLVHVSTDYVFGDSKSGVPHTETDPVSPQGVYAKTKYESEGVALSCAKSFVIRTCGLYANDDGPSATFKNFPSTILRLASSLPELRIVNDQTCTPSFVPHVADAILALSMSSEFGLYHVTNQGATNWFEFAQELLRLAELSTPVHPISTEEFGAVASRPSYSVLNSGKYQALKLSNLPTWQEGLAEYLRRWSSNVA